MRKRSARLKPSTRAFSASRGRRTASILDPADDAPEITDDMLARAEIVIDGKIVRRGRPPIGNQPKNSVTLRLDADVLAAYKADGAGWQTRINDDLRRIRKLKALRRA